MTDPQELQANLRKKEIEFKQAKDKYMQLKNEYDLKKPDNKCRVDVHGRKLPCELYMDGYLKSNMDILYQFVKNDWDGIGFIAGYEGDGKSALAQQVGLYLDANLSLDNIVFNPEQFEEAVDSADPYTAIIWDEADDLGGNWWDEIIQALISKFKRIRKKNLFIILVTPTIFDMGKYFVIHRTRFLIEVYADGTTRGFFNFFNREKKKKLYIEGKRKWDMNASKPSFRGRFTKIPDGFPIDQKEYEDKKDLATESLLKTAGKGKKQALVSYRRDCVKALYEKLQEEGKEWTQSDYAEVFGCHRANISRDMKKLRLNN